MNKTKQMVLALVGVAVLYALLKALIVTGIIGPYWQIILNESMIYVIGGLGLSIIYGFTGQFSLGHAAFVGIGAYCAGWFAITFSHYGSMGISGVAGGRHGQRRVGRLPDRRADPAAEVRLPGDRHPGLQLHRLRRDAEFRQAVFGLGRSAGNDRRPAVSDL